MLNYKKVLVVLVINILAIITLAGNIQFDNISDLAGKFVAATINEICDGAYDSGQGTYRRCDDKEICCNSDVTVCTNNETADYHCVANASDSGGKHYDNSQAACEAAWCIGSNAQSGACDYAYTGQGFTWFSDITGGEGGDCCGDDENDTFYYWNDTEDICQSCYKGAYDGDEICRDYCYDDNDGGECIQTRTEPSYDQTCYWTDGCSLLEGCTLSDGEYHNIRADYCDRCNRTRVDTGDYCPETNAPCSSNCANEGTLWYETSINRSDDCSGTTCQLSTDTLTFGDIWDGTSAAYCDDSECNSDALAEGYLEGECSGNICHMLIVNASLYLNESIITPNSFVEASGELKYSNGTIMPYHEIYLTYSNDMSTPWYDNDTTDDFEHEFRFPIIISTETEIDNLKVIISGREIEVSTPNLDLSIIDIQALEVIDPTASPDENNEIDGNQIAHIFNDLDSDNIFDDSDYLEFNVTMPANTSKIVYLYDPIKSSEKNTLLGIILFLILISFTLIILRNNLIKFYQKIGGILTNKKVLVVLVINILAIITLAGNIQFDNISDLAGKFVAATIGESCTEADNGACWGSETPCCVDSCGCLDGGEGCSSCCPSNDTGQTYYCNDYSVCEYQSIDHLVYPRETKLDDRSVWLTDANGEFTRVLKTEEDVYDMYTISVGYISFNHMINSNELIVMDSDCMYSGSGDWNVNCSLDCLVLQSVNIMGNNSINFYDSGTATLKADIQTNGIIHIRDGCTVTCISGNIFTKGYLPEPTEIIIKDVSGNNIARFNDIFGNVILKGVLEENSNHQRTTNDEWIINNNNEDVFILDKSNGNLYIDGNLFENQESLNPTEGIDFIIKDKLDNVVIYVNESGSLFLKGGLIESGDP